jgi:hypothetical protein
MTMWNDPQIAATNPDLKLPAIPITVVQQQRHHLRFHQASRGDQRRICETVGTGSTVQ